MCNLRVVWTLFLAVAIAFLTMSGLATSAYAATPGLNIQISPLPIELTGTPGSTISTPLRVRNAGTQTEQIKLTLQKVTQDGIDGQVDLHSFSSSDPLPSWVHFSQTNFAAPPGEWQTITMTINLPPSAAYGYYYAVQFQLANSVTPKDDQTGIQGAADIFVLLNALAPGEQAKANVASFVVDHKLYEYLPVNFTIRVHNDGNINIAPHGDIFINKGKKQIDDISVNATEGNILPGSNRLYGATWSDGFPVYKDDLDINGQAISNGHGGSKQHLVWNFSQIPKLRFGHYSAHLVLVYDQGSLDMPSISATASFWVIPWKITALVIFIAVFVMIGIYSTLKRSTKVFRKPKPAKDVKVEKTKPAKAAHAKKK